MHFELSEEHKAVQQAAREFAQNVLKPGVIERDEHQKFPTEEIKQLAELGFMGMMVSPEYGGSGMDTLSYVLAIEEISIHPDLCAIFQSCEICDENLIPRSKALFPGTHMPGVYHANSIDLPHIWPGFLSPLR